MEEEIQLYPATKYTSTKLKELLTLTSPVTVIGFIGLNSKSVIQYANEIAQKQIFQSSFFLTDDSSLYEGPEHMDETTLLRIYSCIRFFYDASKRIIYLLGLSKTDILDYVAPIFTRKGLSNITEILEKDFLARSSHEKKCLQLFMFSTCHFVFNIHDHMHTIRANDASIWRDLYYGKRRLARCINNGMSSTSKRRYVKVDATAEEKVKEDSITGEISLAIPYMVYVIGFPLSSIDNKAQEQFLEDPPEMDHANDKERRFVIENPWRKVTKSVETKLSTYFRPLRVEYIYTERMKEAMTLVRGLTLNSENSIREERLFVMDLSKSIVPISDQCFISARDQGCHIADVPYILGPNERFIDLLVQRRSQQEEKQKRSLFYQELGVNMGRIFVERYARAIEKSNKQSQKLDDSQEKTTCVGSWIQSACTIGYLIYSSNEMKTKWCSDLRYPIPEINDRRIIIPEEQFSDLFWDKRQKDVTG